MNNSLIKHVEFNDSFIVLNKENSLIKVPITSIPVLLNHSVKDVLNFEVDPDGSFVHWPTLDIHIGWEQFLQAIDPKELDKAKTKAAEFNKKYGAAIRKTRIKYDVASSSIEGFSEEHLNKVENGEIKASCKLLSALADAHKIEKNEYLHIVAKALGD